MPNDLQDMLRWASRSRDQLADKLLEVETWIRIHGPAGAPSRPNLIVIRDALTKQIIEFAELEEQLEDAISRGDDLDWPLLSK